MKRKALVKIIALDVEDYAVWINNGEEFIINSVNGNTGFCSCSLGNRQFFIKTEIVMNFSEPVQE